MKSLLAFLAALLFVAPAAAQEAAWGGVYVKSESLNNARSLLPQTIYSTGYIDGILVSALWDQVEPSPGTFDWSLVDDEVKAAVAGNKKIAIAVGAGMFTPAWLYAPPYSVANGTFQWANHGGQRGNACGPIIEPVPWDTNYIQSFEVMMSELAAHLATIPGAAIGRVKLTGVDVNDEEYKLPGCPNSNDNQLWQSLGYTPARIIAASQTLFGAIATDFPAALLDLNVLQGGGMPPINNQGQIVGPRDPSYVDVSWQMISWSLGSASGYGTRFGAQWNGFSQDASRAIHLVIRAGQHGAVVGWQGNNWGGKSNGTECGATQAQRTPCDDAGYAKILDGMIKQGGKFVEIWPANVPQFPKAITAAEQQLKGQ